MNLDGWGSNLSGFSKVFVVGLLVAIVVSAAVIAVLYGALGGTTSSSSSTSAEPGYVNVFGLVSTLGTGTHPTSMVFGSAGSHQKFEAPVSGGRFSVDVPNHDVYNVTMRWSGNYSWQAGETAGDKLTVNMSAGSHAAMSYNVVKPTPESVLVVDGTVAWQMVTSNPVAVRFTAADGTNITATVTAGRTFSLRLPNMMNYSVDIQSGNATARGEWYYAHQLEVRAGVNVIGIMVRISL